MIKLTAISDTHNMHDLIKIDPCDILLHSGDFSGRGTLPETKAFLQWFNKQPAKHKVFISGNHDWLGYEQPELFKEILKEYPKITYLEDTLVEVEGLKIYGYPWTPEFCGWAYMVDRGSPKMLANLAKIPEGIDILLSHGPAHGILDKVPDGERAGCWDLLTELHRIQPRVMVCGHLHSNNGIVESNGIKHINVSMLDDNYRHVFKPTKFEL